MQSWLAEQQEAGKDLPFLSLLTGERIRRATQLCNDLAHDLEVMELSTDTEGIEKFQELGRSVVRLSRPLAPLLKEE